MGLEIKQSLKLSQQLVMTPQLQQAIKLLQLNRLELAETIQQELLENPMLEETEENVQESEINQLEREALGDPPGPSEAQESAERAESAETAYEQDAYEAGEPALGADGGSTEGGDGLDEINMSDQVKEDFDWENYLGEYSSAPASSEGGGFEERETPSHQIGLSLYSATARKAPRACWAEPVSTSAPALIWVCASSAAFTKSPKLPV